MSRIKTRVWMSVLAVIALTAGAASVAGDAPGTPYGKPLTGSDTVKISEVLANPAAHVGKTVRVTGVVTGVCERRGCWMTLASDKEFEELRLKVDDGVIVFPIEAKGKRAMAEGTLDKIEMDMEQTRAYAKYLAEEQGETFDPATVKEARVVYQVRVTGAVIY